MPISFFTNISEEEFKEFLRSTVKEILSEILQQNNSAPEILDIEQAADFLHLKVNTLYEKTSRKQIPHFKKGNKLYFHRSELEAWITEGKIKTNKEIEGEAITFTLNSQMKKAA